jgi:putative membrane protein
MHHFISYDFARGIHIIAVIAWISGMLMLPRFYACVTALPPSDASVQVLLQSAQRVRTLLLTPFMILAWSFGLFLFFSYFAPDWDDPVARLQHIPHWFLAKFTLVLALTAYHGMLSFEGRRLARGERRHSETFWRVLSIAPFVVAIAIVLLATLEP